MWPFCLMLSRREIAFKYDDGINLFGTFRIIIVMQEFEILFGRQCEK